MVNFICVKWGTKYSSEYVNVLFSMLKRNVPCDFTFYCYTDNTRGFDKSIKTVEIQSDLVDWWPKLDVLNLFKSGENILLDLDVVIINKLERLLSVKTRTLSVLYSQWKEGYLTPIESTPTLYNSSVMKWSGDQGQHVYNFFIKNKDKILLKYKGIDRYLFNEPVEVDLLPTSIAYSYWKGVRFKKDTTPAKLRPSYEICIFNHGIKPKDIEGWVSTYWK